PTTWTTTIICTGHASDAAAKPAPADATTNAEATTPTCGCSISTAGRYATGASVPYVAAKHAVLGTTRAAAAEYGRHGIRVNALVVGTTRSEMIDEAVRAMPQLEDAFVAPQIQKRMTAPREIVEAAAWLCSDRASFVTGTAMPVDGGISAQAKLD
ncbi:SDR family oxidoreductase, partial [Streptomyces sp. PH10-H1]|uniref:SDR family NAD(P)-dependent oxidoreductase n=1 Tax=Streptomyces sp. PH10-H1 TaxID=3046212 RepID=UPI0024BAE80D